MVSQVRDRCNMCAGRCREPRRKGTRVAAPSGCIVPWAARASCWPQPQQLLPVSAAGSGRRCCTGAFPRRTIRRVDAVRIHPPSLWEGYYKIETPVPGSDTGVLGGRGWIRTTEAEKQQIYSLSPLATREHAHILFAVIADCLYILSSEVAFVNYFFHGFSLFLSFSIFLRFTAIKALPITAKDPKTFSVLRSFWSW